LNNTDNGLDQNNFAFRLPEDRAFVRHFDEGPENTMMSTGIGAEAVIVKSVPGIEIVRRRGTRDSRLPFVLLHGIGSNAHSFESLIRELPCRFDAIAWNAPGYGNSHRLPTLTPAPRDYADSLKIVLESLNISRVLLVGHSLGALFAACFAATYPQYVGGLALLSPALGYGAGPHEPLPDNVQSRVTELDELGPAAFSKKRSARLVSDPVAMPHVLAAVEDAMAAVRPSGYAQAARALAVGNMVRDLAGVSAPVLLAAGSRDVVTPPANALAVWDAIGGSASFHEIAGAGHALPQEAPETVANLLVEFHGRLS
jgi:pimeloyl-ACP methyl ester carboxylesterase